GVTEEGATEAVSQAEQMLSSRCYQASRGRLGCISCHDPHSAPAPTERREFYRAKCLTCHAERGCSEAAVLREQAEHDSCIVCHAPRLSASDVPHTSQTDHRIPRRRSPARPAPGQTTPNADAITIFESGTPGMSRQSEKRARAILLSMLAERRGDSVLAAQVENSLTRLARAAPDDLAVLEALATVAGIQRHPGEAIGRWNVVLEHSPGNELALQSQALQLAAVGRREEALVCLQEVLAINPWNTGMLMEQAKLLDGLGRYAEAISAMERRLQLDPSRADSYSWLAMLHARLAHGELARHYNELRKRIESSAGQ
ncbi:MAG: hypothetical protein ACM3U2_22655, partial [Deltaproteobacteria bacterium]